MSPADDHSSDWVDRQLRQVELPDGLLARLKKTAPASDEQLDAALRKVVVPDRLLSRLRGIPVYDELELVNGLRDVPVPEGLLQGLQSIPLYSDEHIDAGLRDVPVPISVVSEVEAPRAVAALSLDGLERHGFWRLTAAASLLFVVSTAYLLGIAGLVAPMFHPQAQQDWTIVIDESPLILSVNRDSGEPILFDPDIMTPESSPVVAVATPVRATDSVVFPIDKNSYSDGPFFNVYDLFVNEVGPIGSNMLQLASLFDIEPFVLTKSVSKTPESPDVVRDISSQGVVTGRVDAGSVLFLLRHGVHPFLNPSADPQLAGCDVPLVTSKASYEDAWRLLSSPKPKAGQRREIERILRETVRTEEFLCAIDYSVPPPDRDALAVRVFGGPSPFGQPGDRLLQLIVKAREVPPNHRRPCHLTIAVDTSIAMAHAGSLQEVRQVLDLVVRRMKPGDLISLVAYDDSAYILLEAAGIEDPAIVRKAIRLLHGSSGGANIGEGLRLAATTALSTPRRRDMTSSVLVISASTLQLPTSTAERVEEVMSRLAVAGIRTKLLDLSDALATDRFLTRFAAAGKGEVAVVRNYEQFHSHAIEALNGRPPEVARNVQLRFRFNPQTVAGYRLLGHEANLVTPVAGKYDEIRVTAGQSLTGLFEMKLKRAGSGGAVGWAELVWVDPTSGARHRLVQPVSRLQFATSFAEAAVPLQAAILAAETAERLRKTYFAGRRSGAFEDLRDLAFQVDRPLARQESFVRFRRFLDRLIQSELR